MLIIGHGLCSGGLFALAGLTYEVSGSRRMIVTKGLLVTLPMIILF